MKLLWVKAGKLLPADTGGKIRSYSILRHLASRHEITLLSYYPGPKDTEYEALLKSEFPEALAICTRSFAGPLLTLKYLRYLLDPAPFAIRKFTDPEVRRLVSSWMEEKPFDVCVCDFLAASLNFPDSLPIPTLLFQHNVESALWRRRAGTEANPVKRLFYRIEAAKMARCERKALRKFHGVIAVSDNDRLQMTEMAPGIRISVVPTGVDTKKCAPAPPSKANPARIVFIGSMDWEPNIDAVTYFCNEIFPRVKAEFPSAIFQIVGRTPHQRVQQLASAAVQVTGSVASVIDYLREATVVVVPLRAGGGTRLKIYEAMSAGRAVVSTSIGAEGLEVTNGHDLILADDVAAFADAITLLLRDKDLRHRYEGAAREVAMRYDWSKIAERFADVLERFSKPAPELPCG